jgi:predicted MFS family arabinose efflux permease
MGFGASQVLGIPIGLYLANIWGWQAPFLMIVGLSSMIWLTALVKLQPVNRHLLIQSDKSPITHLLHTVAKRDYRIGFMATACLSLGGFMMMPWGSAFAINNLKLTYAQLPVLFMVAGVATLIIMPIIGKLSDKMEKFAMFAAASIWMAIVVVIYTHLTPVPFWMVLALNVVMMMGIMSRMVPSMALVTALPEMKDRGAFMSVNSSLQQIAGGIAAGVGGMVVVQQTKQSPLEHYDTLGFVVVAIVLVNIFLVYRVNRLIADRQKGTADYVRDGTPSIEI